MIFGEFFFFFFLGGGRFRCIYVLYVSKNIVISVNSTHAGILVVVIIVR